MAQMPIAPVTRLVRNAGAERVSEDASVALVEILEAEGEKIAAKAVSLAKHAGRKTVKKEDIEESGLTVHTVWATTVHGHGPKKPKAKPKRLGPGPKRPLPRPKS
jgi:histone H3/H4